MKIDINMLFEWLPEENTNQEKHKERVLFISFNGQEVVLIDVDDAKALPVLRERSEIELAYSVGDMRIIKHDKFAYMDLEGEDIPEKYRVKRDRLWNIVDHILVEAGNEIYESKTRWKALLKIKNLTGVAQNNLYNYLRRYWQSGFRKNSLLPRYKNCGNPGVKKNNSLNLKLGRRSALSNFTGKNLGVPSSGISSFSAPD